MAAATRWKLVRAGRDGVNMEYQKGQIVGYVDVNQLRGPMETPMPERWYVLRTFPNKERKVMEAFEDRNISAYFPTVRERQRITRRRGGHSFDTWREINPPLFSGIIFIPDFQAKRGGVKVDGVEGYFRMGDCYPYLTPKLMEDVRTLAAIGNLPAARKRRLWTIGQRVYVKDGPFRLFNGQIGSLDSKGRLTVLLEIFARMTPVTLDESQIEAA